MISKRLAHALHRQDWFVVLLEIVIVVVGILIALEVQNWNDARLAQEEAADWRRQILADLNQTRFDLEGRQQYNSEALAFGEEALALMVDDSVLNEASAWTLVLGAFQAGQIWPYRLTGTAFRQAQNAGGLGLVAEPAVIVTLSYLYDVTAHDLELVSGGLPRYREMIRERLDWPLQEYIWDADCQATVLSEGFADYRFSLVHCEKPKQRESILANAEALRKDDALIRALRGRLSQLKISVDSLGRVIERVDNAIQQLEPSR